MFDKPFTPNQKSSKPIATDTSAVFQTFFQPALD